MPKFLLTAWQVNSLIHYGALPEPGPGSPLRALIPSRRPLAPGDPDFSSLVDQSLLREDGRGGWRPNFALLPFLGAALLPDEVISLGIGEPGAAGFTIARRNDVLVDATVGSAGVTKLEFPLTRTAAVLTIIGALSGDRPEPPSTGFRFVGGGAEAFVLAAALRAIRLDGVPLTVSRLRDAVRRDLGVTALSAPFAVGGAPAEIARLATDESAVDEAVAALLAAGHLRPHLDQLQPSDDVRAVLGAHATAVLGIGRTEITDGRARSTTITATRIGDRILSFRVQNRPGEPARFEWMEVSREQLRWLAFAVLLPRAELERLQSGETVEQVTAAGPADAPAATSTAPVEPGQAPTWVPTHTVPADGLAAYERPDPSATPVATLDPWLPVAVDAERNGWSHVVCSNGWTCWVDGRRLTANA